MFVPRVTKNSELAPNGLNSYIIEKSRFARAHVHHQFGRGSKNDQKRHGYSISTSRFADKTFFGHLVDPKGAPDAEGWAKKDSPGEMTFCQNPSAIEKDPIGLAEMSLGGNSLLVWKTSHHGSLRVTTVDNQAVRTEIESKGLPHC
jgi:hypothetical protein